MDSCKVDTRRNASSFQELYDEMQKDTYWIRLFCRPCCPAPDVEGAIKTLDKLGNEIKANSTFSDEEKDRLLQLVEERKEWYPHSGLCRH